MDNTDTSHVYIKKPSFWNFVQCNETKYPESPIIFNRSLIEKMINKMWVFFRSGTTWEFKNELPAIRSNAAAALQMPTLRQHNQYYRGYASNFAHIKKLCKYNAFGLVDGHTVLFKNYYG